MYFCHGEIYVMLDGPGIIRLPRKLLLAKVRLSTASSFIYLLCVFTVGRCLQHLHLNSVISKSGVEF